MYTERYMQPSPAQPRSHTGVRCRRLSFSASGARPQPRVCLADQGSLEPGFRRHAYHALVGTSALLNCEFTMRIDCGRLSLPISGSCRVTRPSFLVSWGLRAGSTTACCHTLLRPSARPCMARMARLSCPLLVVLLEEWTNYLFFCYLLTKDYLGTADSSRVCNPLPVPRARPFSGRPAEATPRQTNKQQGQMTACHKARI